jgi:hypothetical protein
MHGKVPKHAHIYASKICTKNGAIFHSKIKFFYRINNKLYIEIYSLPRRCARKNLIVFWPKNCIVGGPGACRCWPGVPQQ